MLSSFTTKLALKKAGIPKDILDFQQQQPEKKSKSNQDDEPPQSWGSWMSIRSLPLTVQPWLNPPPPVRGLAQKTFINLRTLSNRYGDALTCIAVSHASEQATQKWVSLLGGAWGVRVVIDEERALYAAWGLGTGGMWYLFNPTTQVQGWKETGWLGEKVAGAIQRKGVEEKKVPKKVAVLDDDDEDEDGPLTVMGNKWQEAGAFAIDGTGTVIWGGKAMRADDVMELEDGARILLA
ncbi:hypothetical protein CDV31_000367 [Fusarium ambrosium]|uniref:Uncharacterized protein n=1 Tax=Fusarium ambrosium TaxID=131363 RepID=A0A428V2C2_9HYPO|nr:hypothetical protein CDV31_000367 [Fusarium ambrosium]